MSVLKAKNASSPKKKNVIEDLLQTPNLGIRKDETMNHQEPTRIFLNPDSGLLVSFKNNL